MNGGIRKSMKIKTAIAKLKNNLPVKQNNLPVEADFFFLQMAILKLNILILTTDENII